MFWPILTAKQDEYFAKHDKYFQLLLTPSVDVVDGVDSVFTSTAPDDEVSVIDREFTFSDMIPFNISVNEWIGENGVGYRAIVYIHTLNGDIYTMTRDSFGKNTEWRKLVKTIT